MSPSIHAAPPVERSVRPRGAVAVAALAALDLALVMLLLGVDRVQVHRQQELGRVRLGMPLSWVTQHQGIDPPLPWRTGLLSPWENPTTIAWLALLVDVVVVGLLLTGLWVGVQAVRR